MTAERLQRYLARAGIASRRRAEDLIRSGRVRVNQAVVVELGVKVGPGDRVEVDGRAVTPEPVTWIVLHKPAGYVTTREDPQRRPTVYDLLPEPYAALFHVGRLDRNSEGLLLLTNEGGTAHRLMHPSGEVDRVYLVDVAGDPDAGTVQRLLDGVQLEDGPARAHGAELLGATGPGRARLRIRMREGRKREVRRLLEAVGHPVRRLVRTRLGPIELGELAPGAWRELTPAEVAALRERSRT